MTNTQRPSEIFRERARSPLYHFTDKRNADSIRANGGLLSLSELNRLKVTPPYPGGNDWSHTQDIRVGLDKYVHLCLSNSHPMEYRAREDGRIGDAVFLQICPTVLDSEGVKYAPQVANKAGAKLIPIAKGIEMIDYEALYGDNVDWNHPDIKERRKVAKKCEILIPRTVPLASISNLPA